MRFARLVFALALAFGGVATKGSPAVADTVGPQPMVDYVNDLREQVGAPRIPSDSRINAAAQSHADYLSLNRVLSHYEVEGNPGFTGVTPTDRVRAQGYTASSVSENAATYNGALNAVRELWDAPYHRLGMMHQHTSVMGWGHSSLNGQESTVGNFVKNWSAQVPSFVRSPADGQTGVATSWNGNESPSPLPAGAAKPVGYPIMIIYSNARAVTLRAASLVRASDGASVPYYVAPQQFSPDYQVIIPQRPLATSTTYRVRFDLTVAGQNVTNEWSFTTSADGKAVPPKTFHAAIVDASPHPTLAPGATATLTIRYKNTGTATWERGVSGRQVNLGVPGDSTAYGHLGVNWLSANRVATTQEATVAPGATGTFTFTVRAPTTPGTYRLPLRPVVDGLAWLEDYGAFFTITSDHGYHVAFVDASPHPTLVPGTTTTLTIRYKNSGTSTWQRGVYGKQVNLGVSGDSSASAALGVNWLSANRVATTQEATVAPGATGTFTFTVRAPTTPGTYRLPLRPVVDGLAWLEDYGAFFTITSDYGYHAAFVDASPHPTLALGATATLTLRFRNTGTRAWNRGVSGEQANLGVKFDSTEWASWAVNWLAPNRPATTQEASVAPGQIGTFTFTARAPTTPGVYVMHLRPVIDGVTWMEDHGVWLRITVQ